jgi:hypothetical protein
MSQYASAGKISVWLKCRGSLVIILIMAGIVLIPGPVFADSQFTASTNLVLAKGDPLVISGGGYTNGSVALWGIGPSFFTHAILETTPNGTFNTSFEREITRGFRSGPLFVILEDPGVDSNYSLTAVQDSGKYSIYGSNGTYLFTVDPDFLNISTVQEYVGHLSDLIDSEGFDDSYTSHLLYVEEPALQIDADPQTGILIVPVGQTSFIHGTMNMAMQNQIGVKIENISLIELTGQRVPERTGTAKTAVGGDLRNRWEYSFNASGFLPGEYLLEIGWNRSTISGQSAAIIRITPVEKSSSLMKPPVSGDLSGKNGDCRCISRTTRATRPDLPGTCGGVFS